MIHDRKKKNIVQDVVPPTKRSIRNVELPSRSRDIPDEFRQAKASQRVPLKSKMLEDMIAPRTSRPEPAPALPPEPPIVVRAETPAPTPVASAPVERPLERKIPTQPAPAITPGSYSYDFDEPKSSRRGLIIAVIAFIIVGGFGVSALFRGASVTVTPKSDSKAIDDTFTAQRDASGAEIGYQVVTISKDMDKTVIATGEQKVEKKATGKIVIFNNFSASAQVLVANTRFQTPEGLIFRLTSGVTVPGQVTKSGKVVAGSVDATVVADATGDTYNIPLKDFTIPGFKGDPKFAKIYGRSKTAMTGGFSGMQKVVSADTLTATETELETSLKEALVKEVGAQIPANFVLYQDSLVFSYTPAVQAVGSTTGVVLRKQGTVNAVIFDKGVLTRAIIQKDMPTATSSTVKITNLDSLVFSYADNQNINASMQSDLTFTLKGEAHFVWVFDQNKLQSDLLGLSKKQAVQVIQTYPSIKEAWVETRPFWNSTIPTNPAKLTFKNTLE